MAEQVVELPPKLEFLFHPARHKVAYGGRGAAKSWGFARALLIQAAERPLRILCTRETQTSIAESVHLLLCDQIKALGLSSFYNIERQSIQGLNGSEFIFAGLRQQTVEKVKSTEGVDICWVEEAQAVSAKSIETLIPTIRKPGSELWWSFNPELDTDPVYTRFVIDPPDGAVVVPISYRDNEWFTAELEAERLDLQRRDPEAYANVWEGRCRAALQGAVYAREVEDIQRTGRYCRVPYDPHLKVHCVYDLGWNDAMVIGMWQRRGSELRLIDYIEDSHKRLDEYVEMLKARPFNWGTDYLPHDGAAKDIKSGKSSEEVLRALGRKPRVIPVASVEEGIRASRAMLARTVIDVERGTVLLNHLKRYRRAISPSGVVGSPVHDEHSHAADMVRMTAAIADQMTNDDQETIDMSKFAPVAAGW